MKSAYPPRTIETGSTAIRIAHRGRLVGLDGGEEHEEQDHAELEQADEPLTLDLLAADRFAHPLRQLLLRLAVASQASDPASDHRSASRVGPLRTETGG